MRIGIIGVGNMGSRVATRLAKEHAVLGFDIVPEKVDRLRLHGVGRASSTGSIARQCEVVFMSLPGPREVMATVAGKDGILEGGKPPLVIVDLTTNAPTTSKEVASQLSSAGLAFLEMPVSGGTGAAEQGSLSAFVSGPCHLHDRLAPLLDLFTKKRTCFGEYGKASIVKLLNNRIALQCVFLDIESLVMGAKCGIDPLVLLDALEAGSAGNAQLPRLRLHLFPPRLEYGFPSRLAVKDLSLIGDFEQATGASTAATAAALEEFARAVEAGYAECDQAVIYNTIQLRLAYQLAET